jgi:phosphate:Na+ symporter
MNELAEFVLGLGLFFVGMQMVGEYLRQLSGPSFRSLVTRFTATPWAGAALGLAAGAMMQSATGVTFILVNMVESGLIAADAALPVITWTNVGLTALAFVATLDIHPIVSFAVGLSGIAASLVRHRLAKQVANVLVGIALLLYGLQSMGAAAGPLERAHGLQELLATSLATMPVAFFVGFLLAAILQSNTGATLLVIALASGGVFGLESAVMLIYGTNLGAIVLRLLLSAGMRGTAVQLVHYEDLFCLASGAIMVILFYVEQGTRIPLVLAAAKAVSSDIAVQLALAFLLSNLLPALAMWPLHAWALKLLARIWPVEAEAAAAQPKYLTGRALDDPATAVDLIPRELARLLASLQASVRAHRAGTDSSVFEDRRAADYWLWRRCKNRLPSGLTSRVR